MNEDMLRRLLMAENTLERMATQDIAPSSGFTVILARNYASLADAIAAAELASGRVVVLEPGTTYAVSGTITISTDDIALWGGPGTEIAHTGTMPAFNVTGDGVQFHGIKF